MTIDLRATILADFDRHIGQAGSARHKAMIWNYREHVRCEETGQIDELLTYLTEDAEYRLMGPGEPVVVRGRQAIGDHYRSLPPHEVIDLRLSHLMVTDWGLSGVLESTVSTTPGLLRYAGVPVADEDGSYQMRLSAAFFRPFDGDLASGITYFGGSPQVQRVASA